MSVEAEGKFTSVIADSVIMSFELNDYDGHQFYQHSDIIYDHLDTSVIMGQVRSDAYQWLQDNDISHEIVVVASNTSFDLNDHCRTDVFCNDTILVIFNKIEAAAYKMLFA